jgi:hypothetical protein
MAAVAASAHDLIICQVSLGLIGRPLVADIKVFFAPP